MVYVSNQNDYDDVVSNFSKRNYTQDTEKSSKRYHVFSKNLSGASKILNKIKYATILIITLGLARCSNTFKIKYEGALQGRKIEIVKLKNFSPKTQSDLNLTNVSVQSVRDVLRQSQDAAFDQTSKTLSDLESSSDLLVESHIDGTSEIEDANLIQDLKGSGVQTTRFGELNRLILTEDQVSFFKNFSLKLKERDLFLLKNEGTSRIDFVYVDKSKLDDEDLVRYPIDDNTHLVVIAEGNKKYAIKFDATDKPELICQETKITRDGVEEKEVEITKDDLEGLIIDVNTALQVFEGDYFNNYNIITIKKNREEILKNSEEHLLKLSKALQDAYKEENDEDVTLQILYLHEQGELSEAEDAGGLTRDYLEALIKSLLDSNQLKFLDRYGFKIPCVKSSDQIISKDEEKLYEALGIVLMHCFKNEDCIIGQQFDQSLFNVIFEFKEESIKTNFDEYSIDEKQKFYHAFLNNSVEGFDHLKKLEHLINQENISKEDIKLIEETADSLGFEGFNPDQAKNVLQDIFKDLDIYIKPIYFIAKGMLENSEIRFKNVKILKEKIQGTIDRDIIAKKIDLPNHLSENEEISKKVNWLKNWLKNHATDEEVKQFLKYSTGSTGYMSAIKIKVLEQNEPIVPFIKASTCAFEIKIAPKQSEYLEFKDDSEENFIAALKFIIANQSENFTDQ